MHDADVGEHATVEGGHTNYLVGGGILLACAFIPLLLPYLIPILQGYGRPPPIGMAYIPHTLLFGGLGVWKLMTGMNPPELRNPKIYAIYDTKPSIGSTLLAAPLYILFLGGTAFTTSLCFVPEAYMEISPILPLVFELGILYMLWATYSGFYIDGEKREVRLTSTIGNTFPFEHVEGIGEVQLRRAGSGFTIGWQLGVLLKGEPKARALLGGSAEQVRAAARAICQKTGLVHLMNPDMRPGAFYGNVNLNRPGYGDLDMGSAGLGGAGHGAPVAAPKPYTLPEPKAQAPLSTEELAEIEKHFVEKMRASQKELLRGFSIHAPRATVIATLRALGEKGNGTALKRIKKELRDYVMMPQHADKEVTREAGEALKTIQARLEREGAGADTEG